MARKSIEERLAQLDARRATLKARLSTRQRATDTRRKVLLGALVLHRLESASDPDFTRRLSDWLRRELPGFLTRDSDKELLADLIVPAPDEPADPRTGGAGEASTAMERSAGATATTEPRRQAE